MPRRLSLVFALLGGFGKLGRYRNHVRPPPASQVKCFPESSTSYSDDNSMEMAKKRNRTTAKDGKPVKKQASVTTNGDTAKQTEVNQAEEVKQPESEPQKKKQRKTEEETAKKKKKKNKQQDKLAPPTHEIGKRPREKIDKEPKSKMQDKEPRSKKKSKMESQEKTEPKTDTEKEADEKQPEAEKEPDTEKKEPEAKKEPDTDKEPEAEKEPDTERNQPEKPDAEKTPPKAFKKSKDDEQATQTPRPIWTVKKQMGLLRQLLADSSTGMDISRPKSDPYWAGLLERLNGKLLFGHFTEEQVHEKVGFLKKRFEKEKKDPPSSSQQVVLHDIMKQLWGSQDDAARKDVAESSGAKQVSVMTKLEPAAEKGKSLADELARSMMQGQDALLDGTACNNLATVLHADMSTETKRRYLQEKLDECSSIKEKITLRSRYMLDLVAVEERRIKKQMESL